MKEEIVKMWKFLLTTDEQPFSMTWRRESSELDSFLEAILPKKRMTKIVASFLTSAALQENPRLQTFDCVYSQDKESQSTEP